MITLIIVFTTILLLYWYSTKNYNYWKERGVQYDKPVPLFGTHFQGFINFKSLTQIANELYWKYPQEKIVGSFRGQRPEVIVRDPEIAKQVLIADFHKTHRRGFIQLTSEAEPILRNLFFVDGDTWRLLRQRLTTAFTSGKLKAMFPLVQERAERLRAQVLAAAAARTTLDARDIMARYTTDFIGACGFGLDSDSLGDESSAFRKLGKEIFQSTPRLVLVMFLKELFPSTFKKWKVFPDIEKDLTKLVKDILEQRNFEPSNRNDFIDLLIECHKKGVIEGDSIERIKDDGTSEKAQLNMNVELMAAQVFVFFAAGFETSSSATSFALHQLAYNQGLQEKVQEEIDSVLKKYDNQLCYDAIQEMTYLEWTFKEALRMFPSLGYLQRETASKYTIPKVNVTVDKGVLLMIPLQALHNDSEYFTEPDEFRPERFNPELFNQESKNAYMPFGEGPRACIGARLGLMQSLAGLAAVLSRCSVRPAPETKRYPVVNPSSHIVQTVKDGLPLYFEKRTL